MSGKQLTLIFVHNSLSSGTVSLYQSNSGNGDNSAQLPWFSQFTHPTTRVIFNWNDGDYGFIWLDSGKVAEGIEFNASQFWPADLTTTNQVTLTKKDGAYTFENQTKGPQPGNLYIAQDNTITPDEVKVGVGMGGAPVWVTGALPNMTVTVTPRAQYWIAFSKEEKPQPTASLEAPGAQQIVFPANVTSMTAILNQDGSWIIKPTFEVNADFVAALKEDSAVVWGLHYK